MLSPGRPAAAPGLGYDQTQPYGSRTLGDGLVPGFYNLVVMVEERHNGDASMGYPDHIDDNGNEHQRRRRHWLGSDPVQG